MARRVEYADSEAYNLGYDDGYKDSKEEVSQDPILQSSIKASMEIAVDVAKQEMIDKVCEWLKANRWNYDLTSDYQFEDMLHNLKKAMEE